MSKATVYFKALLHYWWEDGHKRPCVEVLEKEVFDLECRYALPKNQCTAEEACSESVYCFLDGDFIIDYMHPENNTEGVYECVGKADFSWETDYWGETDEDYEIEIIEKYRLTEEQMKKLFEDIESENHELITANVSSL
jgi:hypothetical protein